MPKLSEPQRMCRVGRGIGSSNHHTELWVLFGRRWLDDAVCLNARAIPMAATSCVGRDTTTADVHDVEALE